MFKKAGLSIDGQENMVEILKSNHVRAKGTKTWSGRSYHDPEYHDWVKKNLDESVKGIETVTREGRQRYREALSAELGRIKALVKDNQDIINKFRTP